MNHLMSTLGRTKKFCKVSLFAGLGVVLPVLLSAFLLGKILSFVGKVTDPVARSLFPVEYSLREYDTEILALLLLIFLSMVLGLVAQTSKGQQWGQWLESRTLVYLPMYRDFKEFSARLIPSQTNTLLQPALLTRCGEMVTLIFVVEELSNGYYVIFLPGTPSTFNGTLNIVPKTDVEILNVHAMDMVKVFSRWGVGAGKLVKESRYLKSL